MTATPTLVWAQRAEKVFVTFEQVGTKNVQVTLSEGLLSIEAEAGGKTYKLENLKLFAEIDCEDSKWKANDRYRAYLTRHLCVIESSQPTACHEQISPAHTSESVQAFPYTVLCLLIYLHACMSSES